MIDKPSMQSTPNPYPSPRARFLSNTEFVKQHAALLQNAAFSRAIETALAEMTRAVCNLSNSQDLAAPGAAQAQATSFAMINGAHNFLEVLYRLSEPYQMPKARSEPITSLEATN